MAIFFWSLDNVFSPKLLPLKAYATCGQQINLFIGITKSEEFENFRSSDTLG